MPALVALLSDFGSRDWFVAAMKAVVLRHDPDAILVDITHEVPPGDVRTGAFILSQCWRDFPPGTTFLAVVDPGVGSERAGVVVQLQDRLFIGPDNGIFSLLTLNLPKNEAVFRELENPAWRPPEPSATFHGRDIFGPAAGILSSGTSWVKAGPILHKPVTLPWPKPAINIGSAEGEIIHFDRFGNAITNLRISNLLDVSNLAHARLTLGRRRIPLVETYSDVSSGSPLAYFGSGGFLEIALRDDNILRKYDLKLGQCISLKWSIRR